MASGSNHIIIGSLVAFSGISCLICYQTACFDCLVLAGACLAGSLFPDIDIKSKGQKLFYTIMAPFYLFLFSNGHLFLSFSVGLTALMAILCNHRGLFHSWWFIIIFSCLWGEALLRLFPTNQNQIILGTLFFIGGALSHLLLDFGPKKLLFR